MGRILQSGMVPYFRLSLIKLLFYHNKIIVIVIIIKRKNKMKQERN